MSEHGAVRRPYTRRLADGEPYESYFLVGFCPRCLCRLPVECTFPHEEAQADLECVYCGVEWVDPP